MSNTEREPIIMEVSDEQRKNYAKNLLDREIADYKRDWLEKPAQIQMEEMRNPIVREALIDLEVVDEKDPRVIQIIAEEQEAIEYIQKVRNQNAIT